MGLCSKCGKLVFVGCLNCVPLTQKAAIKQIREMGLTVNVNDGEYRINIKNGKEETAYYTHHPVDAVATARHMKKVNNAT